MAGEPNPQLQPVLTMDVTPSDTLFPNQWHLKNQGQNGGLPGVDLNVTGVWPDYTGAGVSVALIDDGFDLGHADLIGHFDTGRDFDFKDNDSTPMADPHNNHGTAVSGVIGAGNNGVGSVGVAYGATLVGLRVAFGPDSNVPMFDAALERMKNFDVVNNSWGYTGTFSDNFNASWVQVQKAALLHTVQEGRAGLGTNVVFAAGNSAALGDNVNYHNFQNSSYAISVGALTNTGALASFSNPGAALLISAPGADIITTDITGAGGYFPTDYVTIGGTSFAAPMVSGVIALMLDANPDLGYRDVQEILAYAARKVGAAPGDWQMNGAVNWNGGGLHFSHSYGFGLVDAHAAVRLAETWELQHTYNNLDIITGLNTDTVIIPGGAGLTTSTITLTDDVIIDRIEVTIDITHENAHQLDIALVSPDGTRSILADNAPYNDEIPTFTFNTVANWGEHAQGTWTLEVSNGAGADAGTIDTWSVRILGDAVSNNDLYIYTDEYAGGTTITDMSGTDTLNAAAVTASSFIGERGGSIGGRDFAIAPGTLIEKIYTGDGSDAIIGNAANNIIHAGRGDDSISQSAGDDVIDGGAGHDMYISSEIFSHVVTSNAPGDITITSRVNSDTVRLLNIESFMFGGHVYDTAGLLAASRAADLASVTYFVHGDLGIARQVSNAVANNAFTASNLHIGGEGVVLLAERSADHLTLTNNAGAHLNAVSMHLENGLALTTHGFGEVNIVADGDLDTLINIGGGQRGFIQTNAGDDTISFLAFLLDANAPAQERTLTARTGAGDDTVTIEDRSDYLAYDIDMGAGDDRFVVSGTVGGRIYGGNGADTFAFEKADGIADGIYDFSVAQNDRLDLSKLIEAHDPSDPIANFIQMTQTDGNTTIAVDHQDVATLYGTLLSDSIQHYVDIGVLVVDQA